MVVDLRKAYQYIQDETEKKEPFNQDIIDFKKNEDIPYIISNICRGLDVIDGFKFLDVDMYKPDEVYNPNIVKSLLAKNKSKDYMIYPIEQSRYMIIDIHYELSAPNDDGEIETKDCHTKVFYPELLSGQYFSLKNNRFFPVMQLANAEFYRSQDAVVLKTMFMPLKIKSSYVKLKDLGKVFGREGFKTRRLEAVLFSKSITVFKYFFAKFGIQETMRRFGLDSHMEFLFEEWKNIDPDDSKYYFRCTKKITLAVDKNWFHADINVNPMLTECVVSVFNKSMIKVDKFYDTNYWYKRLGSEFTTNGNRREAKAKSIILSLERILDDTTKSTLRLDDKYKKDVYTMMQYMIVNYNTIIKVDNHNLANRRVRVAEYLLYPFTKKLSDSVYRLVNESKVKMQSLENIFSNIDEMFIIKRMSTIQLLRYSNNSSSLDLFASTLKASKSGPQTQAGSTANQGVLSKTINTSYLGKIDTTATSSGDPGTSATMVPFVEVKDPTNAHQFFFTDKPEFDTEDELEDIQYVEDTNAVMEDE